MIWKHIWNLIKKLNPILTILFLRGNVSKYEFLTAKDVLPEKAAAMKRFEHSPLGKESQTQTEMKLTLQRNSIKYWTIIFGLIK